MFLHNYMYKMKCIIRDRQMLFWTLVFPIILATLFHLAFSNLTNAEQFKTIKLGIVENEEFKANQPFRTALEAVSVPQPENTVGELFELSYITKDEGDKLLSAGLIKGYIYLDNGIKLVVKDTGIYQSIIKSFIDDFKQTSSTIETIITNNPSVLERGFVDSISNRYNYLQETALGKASPDITAHYFYALIAMACLYGGFWGLKEVIAVQADLSEKAKRINAAPTHKMKVFITSIMAAATVQLFEILLLLAYLIFVLNINFGGRLGLILLTCVIGTITGVTFGAFIASVVKGTEGVKIGILIAGTMTLSFLSGMMYDKMKYIIRTNVPVLGYLNPANLITDAFYSLYYYDTYTRFFSNIITLCGFIVFFGLCTYFVLRRQKYASL
jgi:ABC-2 type transport system permease protein